jgi:hypothetical protein
MAQININIGKDDVLNINVTGTQQQTSEVKDSEKDIDALHDKLRHDLNVYNNKRYEKEHDSWWYEVFYDFTEDFDDIIYPKIKDMPYEEQYTFCLGYMWKRDSYYFSDEHYDFLNAMVKVIKEEDFKK